MAQSPWSLTLGRGPPCHSRYDTVMGLSYESQSASTGHAIHRRGMMS
jgi:hypothetical protein